ncbi:2-hydroxycarboxylate transporter family protein [Coraliomargarita parva]|uniref:2-hydroxycarboxylate transporter family protein n=1 Tax=Coraliomargarita parva TaxID=3014050 RepID=UPI0022B4B2F3|nr:2-hydroxycarboxylate transporter family protein [Coraliomargarita parva]
MPASLSRKTQYLCVSIALAIVIAASCLGVMPNGMIGAFGFLIAVGGLLAYVGDRAPIFKDYLGGAPFLCIFGAAFLVYLQILPEDLSGTVKTFMKQGGFLNFYIASLISGSILGMDRRLLKQAGPRYVFPLVGGVICAMVLTGLVGLLLVYGFKQTLIFVCFPIIGGGMGAGAVPMSEIVSKISGSMDAKTVLSKFVPALAIGNVLAIVIAGLLNKLGQRFPKLTGNGVLMKGFEITEPAEKAYSIDALGVGLFASCIFFISGYLIHHFIPWIHGYALMIILVGVLKVSNVIPEAIENACSGWYQFVVKNFTPALLVGIGIAYTDLHEVFQTISPTFFILVATTVLSIVIASGYIGMKVGFYFIESALTSGLGMADMGGTGDVAVLSAAKRMELMPFMQISSRLGGALILVLVSFFAPLLLT